MNSDLLSDTTRAVAAPKVIAKVISSPSAPVVPVILSHTHFELKETNPANVVSEFNQHYSNSQEFDFEVDNLKIKGVKYLPSLQVNFNANIFSREDKLVLELNRESGCVLAFNDMYQDMKSKLSSVTVEAQSSFPSFDFGDDGIEHAVKVQFVASTLASLLMMAQTEPKMAIQAFQSLNSLFTSESLAIFTEVSKLNPEIASLFNTAFAAGLSSEFLEIRTWSLVAVATAIKRVDGDASLYELFNAKALVSSIIATTAAPHTMIPDSIKLATKEFSRSYIAAVLALLEKGDVDNKDDVYSTLLNHKTSVGVSGRSKALVDALDKHLADSLVDNVQRLAISSN